MQFDAKAGWLKFAFGGLLCVFNFAADAQRVRMPRGAWDLALRSDTREATPVDEVPGHGTLIYRRRES